MRVLLLPALLVLTALPFGNPAPLQPVVVELFTSEGCSSCPPADQLLIELGSSPLAGVQVIPLGLHVDYWDHQGWRDRFSSARFTERQEQYSARLRTDSVYTPQAVVDGRFQTVGSDRDALIELISRAAREPKPVTIDLAADQRSQALGISCRAEKPTVANVLLVITEDDLSSNVTGGENQSRRLRHGAVVRSLEPAGAMNGTEFSVTTPLRLQPAWRKLHAVVLAQDDQGRIVGAATTALR